MSDQQLPFKKRMYVRNTIQPIDSDPSQQGPLNTWSQLSTQAGPSHEWDPSSPVSTDAWLESIINKHRLLTE